jgi:inner membrane protein
LAGWALGQAGLKTQTRKGLAALILGANMPDIDVFLGSVPWEPLAMHRGFTHSLVGGAVVMPPILAGLLWLLDGWQVNRGASFKSGLSMRWRWLLAPSYIGAISHPLLDVLTTYSVRLLSPFSNAWYHSDGLFIIDIWIWLLLGCSIAFSKWKEKRGLEWRRPPQVVIGIILVYIAVNVAISQRAYAAVRQWAGERPAEAIFASPPPIYSWRRELVWIEGDCYRRSRYEPLVGFGTVGACEPTNMGDPAVREAIRRSKILQKFLKWSILPQAEVVRLHCRARVMIGDARYGHGASSRLGRSAIIETC